MKESEDIIVRQATTADLDALEELEQKCFATPWSRQSLEEDMTGNSLSTYLVAEIDGRVIGYIGLWRIVDEGHINNVSVLPEYRRRRAASALIEYMFDYGTTIGIKNYTLEVRVSNEAAIRLYAGYGFKPAGIRRGYYTDNGEDAMIMWRIFDPVNDADSEDIGRAANPDAAQSK